jgi:hypothetical protein
MRLFADAANECGSLDELVGPAYHAPTAGFAGTRRAYGVVCGEKGQFQSGDSALANR